MNVNIAHELRKCLPYLLKAKEENLNEADTSQRIVKVFEDVLGYNPITEISRELEVRCKYVDLTIKIDGASKFFVEVKSAGTALKVRHIEQGERYASEANIQWVLLTNGVDWNLYHLTFDEGIEYEQAFAVTLSPDSVAKCAEMIGLLHRTSIRTGEHDKFWERFTALGAESIGRALFTEDVMLFVRREIRRKHDILVGVEDIAAAIHSLFTPEAKERIGPPKIRIRRVKKTDQIVPLLEATPPIIGGI
jgi:hypothetical protein